MPRGRPDPFGQVADGGRFHLVPGLQILEQDRAQLDEAQRGLASGDDGVHARAVAVVRADAAVAVAVECCRVTARPAVTLAGDQIDERCFLGLLHGLPFSVAGQGANGTGADGVAGPGGTRFRRVLAQYTGPNPPRQEGNRFQSRNSAVWGNGQDALPIRKYWASAPSSWSVASIWPARIALDRAGRGRRSPGFDAVVGGHPQHAQHVRPVRHEDRVIEIVRPQQRPDGADRFERRPAVLVHQDRLRRDALERWRSRGRWPPRSSGRRWPCRRSGPGVARCRRAYSSTAWSSLARNSGDGRPSYWAAPSTTMASAGRRSSRSPWAQTRNVAYPATSTMARQARSPTFSRSRRSDRGFNVDGRTSVAAPGSAPVTLLVLRAGTAPARIVAPDPCAAGGEPGLRPAAPAAGPPPSPVTGWSPSDSRIGRDVGGGGGPPRRMADPPAAAAAGTRASAATPRLAGRPGSPARPLAPFPPVSAAAPRASEAATAGSDLRGELAGA